MKRGSSIIQLDSEDEEVTMRRRRSKQPKAAAQVEEDSTEPFGTLSSRSTTLLQAAFASILEAHTPGENTRQVSSVESSVSGEDDSTTSQLSERSCRVSHQAPPDMVTSSLGMKRDLHMILEASALLSQGMLRHPLASCSPPGMPALNQNGRLLLPIGKPLSAPPRLPQLTPGQRLQRRATGNSFNKG